MRGHLSSEEICREIEQAGLGQADEHLEALKRSCEDFLPAPAVIEALTSLACRADVVLVSDNMDCFARWTVPTLKPLGIFKELVISSDVGLLKNDDGGRVFLDICSRYGAKPHDVVFIDDSASTRQTFERLGGQALPTNSPEDTVKVIQSLLEKL
jgi:FMN phosphatase YigB (HAD superfamily)